MTDKDYYAILGVETSATTEEIRKAFQKKARVLHPDVNKAPDAEERFKEVSEAYAVLSDDEKRRRYDLMRAGVPYTGTSSPQGAPHNPWAGTGSPFGGPFPFGGAARRSSRRAYKPEAGADVIYELVVDRDDPKSFRHRTITYQRYVPCDVCDGRGSVEEHAYDTCPTCGGSGHINVDLNDVLGGFGFGFGTMVMECPECRGTGRVVAGACSKCAGTGRVMERSEVEVDIPANAHDGSEIRIPGMGNAGTNNERTGDFVCRIVVPAERLSRRSANGFSAIGLGLIILIVGLLFMGFSPLEFSVMIVAAVPAIYGIFLVLSEGVLHRASGWWRKAGQTIIGGMSQGLMVAIFLVLFMSCTMIRPYGYYGW